MRSLRNQLLASLFALVTVLGALGGIGAYLVSRGEVDQSLDGQLRQIALNVGDTDNPVSPDRADGVKLDPEDAFVVTIWDMQGAPLSSDPSFHPPRPRDTGYANFAAQGEQWRAYALVGPNRTVQVAQRMVVRDEFAADSALRAVLPFAAMIPLGWLVVGLVVGRVLRPIRGVTEQLRRWGRSTTSPLVLDDVPDEIMPLALATNDLVTRLQSQLEFREQFISDAAHELRTPLTALRLQARNLKSRLNAPEEASLLAEMEKGVLRMSDMVTKMLQLARADASAALRNPVNVDLNEVIAGSLEQVMPMAIAKEIDLGVADSVPAMVTADPDEIRTLVTNLVENAVRYTPDGGTVDVSLRQRDSHVDLQVRDTGPGHSGAPAGAGIRTVREGRCIRRRRKRPRPVAGPCDCRALRRHRDARQSARPPWLGCHGGLSPGAPHRSWMKRGAIGRRLHADCRQRNSITEGSAHRAALKAG